MQSGRDHFDEPPGNVLIAYIPQVKSARRYTVHVPARRDTSEVAKRSDRPWVTATHRHFQKQGNLYHTYNSVTAGGWRRLS